MEDFSFPKALRLTHQKQFRRVAYQGKRLHGSYISIEAKPNGKERSRLGLTVSKRFGKSHERNRFKRLIREAFRLRRLQLPVGLDIVVKPLPVAKGIPLNLLADELIHLAAQCYYEQSPRVSRSEPPAAPSGSTGSGSSADSSGSR